MTTEKSAVTTTNCSGPDDSQPPVKRYDLGPRYEQGFSAPDIIEKTDGRFVLYDEVLPLLKIIQLQEALLAKHAVEKEDAERWRFGSTRGHFPQISRRSDKRWWVIRGHREDFESAEDAIDVAMEKHS